MPARGSYSGSTMKNHDGDIEYASLSDEELREALEGIDRAAYPLNFKNLTDEMATRRVAPSEPPLGIPTLGSLLLYLCIVATVFVVFDQGLTRFPDNPIEPCGTNRYCGKQGQPHTREEYRAYRRWQTTMLILWPGGFLTIGALGWWQIRTDRTRRAKS
jgi:hypothetical protein